jgi:hypothetical protein
LTVPPEPESRSGLSLARNSAFATIARSTFPTCAFNSTPLNHRESVRFYGSFAPFGFEADPGRYPRRNPFSACPFQRFRDRTGIHSPSGLDETLRIKAFDRPRRRKPA